MFRAKTIDRSRTLRPEVVLLLCLAAAAVALPVRGDDSLSDPMRPPVLSSEEAASSKEPKYVLHGTILGAERRVALVNGAVLELGDRIGEAELVGIDAGRVILAEDDAELELTTTSEQPRDEKLVVADQRVAHEDS